MHLKMSNKLFSKRLYSVAHDVLPVYSVAHGVLPVYSVLLCPHSMLGSVLTGDLCFTSLKPLDLATCTKQ